LAPLRRLDQPGRLGQRADLVRQELLLLLLLLAHAAASVVAVFALPSRASFSRANGSETYCRSPFGTSATRSARCASRSAKDASSRGSSARELRASRTPASRSLLKPSGTSSRCVA